MLTRVFIEEPVESGDFVCLPDKEAEHVYKVLRARGGESIEVVDNRRRLFVAELPGKSGEGVRVLDELPAPDVEANLHLYQAVPKGRHMDLVVEKATELGVARVIPLYTDRGVVKPGNDTKVERWRRVAVAAARQSLQVRIPEVDEPHTFARAVEEAGESGVVLHVGERVPQIEEVLSRRPVGSIASLFVGPEGGWSEAELDLTAEKGLPLAGLGPYRLRSETAGICAVARAGASLRAGLHGDSGPEA